MTAREQGLAAWSQWQWGALVVLSLVIASFVAASSLSHIARAAGILRDWPLRPYITAEVDPGTPPGWRRVEAVTGGADAQAGVRPGDLVQSAVPGVAAGDVLAPGTRLPLTIERNETQMSATLVVPEQPAVSGVGSFVFVFQGLAGLVSVSIGLVLMFLRGRQSRPAAMLGMLLLSLGFSAGGFGMLWAPTLLVAQFREVMAALAGGALCFFLPLAGYELSSPQGDEVGRWIKAGALLLGTAQATVSLGAAVWHYERNLTHGPVWISLAALLCVSAIARNYRRNDPPARNRIKIVLLAFACYIVSFALFFWFLLSGETPNQLWIVVASAVTGLAGPAFIAYAMLRRKLFDIGFAINRTLVYGAVSFTLLAAFGLAEWGADRLVPESWHHESALYSAGIALLLFLSFHRNAIGSSTRSSGFSSTAGRRTRRS